MTKMSTLKSWTFTVGSARMIAGFVLPQNNEGEGGGEDSLNTGFK